MPPQTSEAQPNAWWTTVRHGGVLISPIVLEEKLPDGPSEASEYEVDRLRRAFTQFQRDPERELSSWLDAVLESFLGHTSPNWQKGQNVSDKFRHTEASGQVRKPSRVLLNALKEHEPRFLVLVDKDRLLKDDGTPGQIGVHGGRRTFGQFLALMRATNVKLGILTNGFHFRLIYAGLDTEAWTEWSAAAWFEGGDGRRALDGFRSLLGVERIPPDSATSTNALLEMVEDSRKRQADLSHVMGTQVREAVEILLNSLDNTLATRTPEERDALLAPLRRLKLQRQAELDALYQAAIRVVMRLVVTAYAESRGLFPVDQAAYLQSYSLEVLFRQLQQAKVEEGIEALHQQEGAWPRIVGQARLVHTGSRHQGLQMVAYGGRLFQSPTDDTTDAVLAALSILESPDVRVSDATVYAMLELLKVGRFKSGRGKSLKGPVDFSDLRTEYIGMMYEGLLDYQLREARAEDGGIVFLNLGEQPALPLRVLTALTDDRLKKLVVELNKKTKGKSTDAAEDGAEPEEEEGEEGTADEVEEALEDEAAADAEALAAEVDEAAKDRFEAEVMTWALKAVRTNPTIFLHPKARKEKDPTIRRKAEEAAARRLILKQVPPGGTYLVRWSGTRKGTGTFYTKPALAVPTVNRTLEPLAYNIREDGTKIPKTPEEILSLKVCDPAMGSGSFLVAALRYLTRALQESFEEHVFSDAVGRSTPVTAMGTRAEGLYRERLLPLRHEISEWRGEGPDPNLRIESELKRSVVEHCIYGVDLNPLAVELGKLSLWVETMDARLTFAFLDHKVKCGNSLIGAWHVQAEHYPLGAWERELGDGKTNPRTKRLQKIRKDVIVPEMQRILDTYTIEGGERRVRRGATVIEHQRTLSLEPAQSVPRRVETGPVRVVKGTQQATITADSTSAEVAGYSRDVYRELHETFDPKEQETQYRKLLSNEGYQRQKFLLDMWCAAWFWPIRAPETAPLNAEPILAPKAYYAEREKPGALAEETRAVVQSVADQQRFFHWEIEFPEVFDTANGRFGFDSVLGNPPWETAKPQDNEFFTLFDPAYRTYGKQEGLKRQKEIFTANAAIQDAFWSYQEGYKSQSNFVRNSHAVENPRLGGSTHNDKWTGLTREGGQLLPGLLTPYAYQGGGDLNLYKLFLELVHATTRRGGRFGMLVPGGIYNDQAAEPLRTLFLRENKLEWIYSILNRRKYFPIDWRYRFCFVIVNRGGQTETFRSAFLVEDIDLWAEHKPPAIIQTPAQIERLSPYTKTMLEVRTPRDLEVLLRIYDRCKTIADPSAEPKIDYVREFDVTNDSELFVHRDKMLEAGYQPDITGQIWRNADGDEARPVYEGRMVGLFDACKKGYVSGGGRTALWRELPPGEKRLEPQYLMRTKTWAEHSRLPRGPTITMMDVASATNTRTMIVTLSPDTPHIDKTPRLLVGDRGIQETLAWLCVFGSMTYDFTQRIRFSATSLKLHFIQACPRPSGDRLATIEKGLVARAAALLAWSPPLAPYLAFADTHYPLPRSRLQDNWLRAQIDALVAWSYGLSREDYAWILRNDESDPKGFWRVDRDLPPELRLPSLSLIAFTDLEKRGPEEFARAVIDFPPELANLATAKDEAWPDRDWDTIRFQAHELSTAVKTTKPRTPGS